MKTNTAQLLIIDDDRAVCTSLKLLLTRAGFGVSQLHHPRDMPGTLASSHFDMVLLDMNFTINTSGRAGLEALTELRRLSPKLPVILITGWATVQLAVEGMKAGAVDFIAKPWDNKALLASIKTHLKLHNKPSAFAKTIRGFDAVIGESQPLKAAVALASQVADTDASVLLTGESGTGKEVLAEAIHQASHRKNAPFVAVNLGGIPEGLFESEFFGHRAGAFTDARADRAGRLSLAEGGTLFLDEVGDTPLNVQVKLLRMLQEHTYEVLGESKQRHFDARIICATHRDLPAMVASGTFREDLYYRINLVPIELPPLRERGRDVVLLAQHFLQIAAAKYQREMPQLSPKLEEYLMSLLLPGNVRQLQNLMERCALLFAGQSITAEQFASQLSSAAQHQTSAAALDDMTLEDIEKVAISRALNRNRGQISSTARDLGLSRTALYRRLEKYELNASNHL